MTYTAGGSATSGTSNGPAGAANTGEGGDGAGNSSATATGGVGGSGVVIIRILTVNYTGTTTGSPTVTTDGDYKVIKFTVTGSYTA